MDRPEDASVTTRTTYERDTETRWAHRNLGGAWWLALAAVPLLLAALVAGLRGGAIEDDLTTRASATLADAGLDGVDVSFDGRDATVSAAGGAVSADDLARAKGLVAEVEGVRVVDVDDAGAASGEPSPSEEPSPSQSASSEPAAACDAAAVQTQIDGVIGDDKVTFGEGSAELEGASADEVAQVAALLVDCPDLAVTVTGSSDTPGAKTPASKLRAQAVKAALVDGGVAEASVTTIGARDTQPLGDNSTPEGRDMNRYANIQVK